MQTYADRYACISSNSIWEKIIHHFSPVACMSKPGFLKYGMLVYVIENIYTLHFHIMVYLTHTFIYAGTINLPPIPS